MTGTRRNLGLALASLVLLAGCSAGPEAPPLYGQILAGARAGVATRAARGSAPTYSRAQLDQIEGSFIEVRRERSAQRAYLYAAVRRRDATPGRITVWRTGDNVTLATRNGVLIATRGLGGDMLSSSVPVRGTAAGPGGSGRKVHMIRARDNKAVPVQLSCSLADLGPETIEIVSRRHSTRHLQERCTATGDSGGGQVVNDYWIAPDRRLVWQSRQWAGPEIGYLQMRRLIE